MESHGHAPHGALDIDALNLALEVGAEARSHLRNLLLQQRDALVHLRLDLRLSITIKVPD